MSEKSWREFIEDSNGHGSGARLNMVVGVFIGSIVILWLTFTDRIEPNMFGIFMLATGGVYGVARWSDSSVQRAQIKSDAAPIKQPRGKGK